MRYCEAFSFACPGRERSRALTADWPCALTSLRRWRSLARTAWPEGFWKSETETDTNKNKDDSITTVREHRSGLAEKHKQHLTLTSESCVVVVVVCGKQECKTIIVYNGCNAKFVRTSPITKRQQLTQTSDSKFAIPLCCRTLGNWRGNNC